MQVRPHNKEEWLRLVTFPFKAYVIIAPVFSLILISEQVLRSRHVVVTDAQLLLQISLLPCAVILLFAALVFALTGPKGNALPCVGFAVAAIVISYMMFFLHWAVSP